ncbi:MAG: serine/threonine-protein kinase, partial [Planctomycetota bacterium]
QRFEAERQALALMDHPHIARVLDAGQTETGLPYFVMELVRGVPITEYCDQHKLNSEQRLRLFIDVCDAVQHAHQKGIIHRDIKPHNILVTTQEDQPVAKVIDFGVAKALHRDLIDDQAYTAISQLVGTPLYMSPEQADLNAVDIDIRSDIYSLGVLLYELLTGVTPIESARLKQAAFDEVRRIIREEEPQKPSTRISSLGDTATDISELRQSDPADLAKQLSGDLDLIVMKALEKDRARRYETANGFAADVERYLNHEPVLASPPSNLYKFRKFVRRNRTGVLATSLVAMALVLGVVGTSLGMVSALRQKDRADRAAEVALQEKTEAQKQASRREALSDFLIMDLLWQADPELNDFEDQVTVLEVLNRAAARIDGSDKFANSPEAEFDVRVAIGQTYFSLGAYDKARKQLEAAYKLGKTVFGPQDYATLYCMNILSNVMAEQGDAQEAERIARLELEFRKQVHGPEARLTLKTQNNFAERLNKTGKYDEAEQLHRDTLATRRRLFGENSVDTLESLHNLGCLMLDTNQNEEAIPLLRAALEGRCEHPDLGVDNLVTIYTRHALAVALKRSDAYDEALELMKAALEQTKRVEGPNHPNVYTTINTLGSLYLDLERPQEALDILLPCLEKQLAIFDRNHPRVASTMSNVGAAYRDLAQYESALRYSREAHEIYVEIMGPADHWTINSAEQTANCLNQLKRHEEAQQLLEQAITDARALDPPQSINRLLSELATTYELLGKPEAAQAWRDQVPEEDEPEAGRTTSPDDPADESADGSPPGQDHEL